jgi:hypothetical protein
MLVSEYLERYGLTEDDMAARLGLSAHGIKSYRTREMPPRWLATLGSAPVVVDEAPTDDSSPFVDNEGQEPRERTAQHTPHRPAGGTVVGPPLDYSALAGYIEGAYKLGGHTLGVKDPVLGSAIEANAQAAGAAWAKWVRSEPKVAALLQRMMIGTPMGEVIGVHLSIAFAYFLARGAVRDARAAEAEAEYGSAEAAAEDLVADTP